MDTFLSHPIHGTEEAGEKTITWKIIKANWTSSTENNEAPAAPLQEHILTQTAEPGTAELEARELAKQLCLLNFHMVHQSLWRKKTHKHIWIELEERPEQIRVFLTNGRGLRVQLQMEDAAEEVRVLDTILNIKERSYWEKNKAQLIRLGLYFTAGVVGVLLGFRILLMMVG